MLIAPEYSYRFDVESNTYVILVTPPTWTGFKPSELVLNADQFERFKQWGQNGGLIQDCLPDLTPGQREILLTGISEDDFDAMFKEDE